MSKDTARSFLFSYIATYPDAAGMSHGNVYFEATGFPRHEDVTNRARSSLADRGHPNADIVISGWYDPDEVKEAFDTLKAAMVADEPGVPGSYAYTWHRNIAMACYEAIHEDRSRQYSTNHGDGHEVDYNAAHRIGNKAATRFMKQCFGVNTKA